MYGHYEYGSQHTVSGSSSQPIPFGSSSQPNVGGSSSLEQSPIKEMEEIQVPTLQKKPNQRRQTSPKKRSRNEKAEDQREGSINLNTTVGDEEDEVEEVRRPRPMGRVQAKRKAKAGSAASSTSAFDVESLAKIMANEYLMDSDPYNVQKNQEMTEL
ncbi:hypothetical protein Tco_0539635 [Tanacetum coccineum]